MSVVRLNQRRWQSLAQSMDGLCKIVFFLMAIESISISDELLTTLSSLGYNSVCLYLLAVADHKTRKTENRPHDLVSIVREG